MRLKLNYIIIPLIIFGISFFGGRLTDAGMNWYKKIIVPDFTPPGYIIGIVWTIIFILFALSIIIVWNKTKRDSRFWTIIGFFILNGALNIFWSFLFFYSQLIKPAIYEAVLLDLTVILLIILIWPISRLASLLLLPYALWTAFATYLTYSIWLLNK